MDYRYKQLEQGLAALSKAFSELGVHLTDVAKEVISPGVMPSEKLPAQISASRASFEGNRSAVHGHAGAMLVSPLPKLEELVSIAGIETLLKASAVAEENKFSVEGERERGLLILARALTIFHKDSKEFKPLVDCQRTLSELKSAISNVLWPHRHPESELIVNDKHPVTALLSLVEQPEDLDDEVWMAVETAIGDAYGKPLFVAASRGKLGLPPTAAKPAAVVAATKTVIMPAPTPEKPVEKTPITEKIEKVTAPVATPTPASASAPPAPAPAVAEKKETVAASPAVPAALAQPVPVSAPAVEKKDSLAPEKPAVKPQQAPPALSAPAATSAPAPVAAPEKIEKKEASDNPQASAAPAAQPTAAPAPTPKPPVPVTAAPTPGPGPAVPARPAALVPTPYPVAAPPAATATPAPASQPSAASSLAALATATEPVNPPVASTEKRERKEPRLATVVAQPVVESESRPDLKSQETIPEEAQKSVGPDGRPQRWGFWRGNR